MTHIRLFILSALCLVVCPSGALAESLFPAGQYPDLDQQMERHGRQFYALTAAPFGLSLDTYPKDVASVALIDQFLAQDASDDVEAVTGKHPFELIAAYGEYGDLGFFGGAGVVATAYEYLTYKKFGAPAADLERARARVVRAAESWHVFKVVTGGGGLVARGIRRLIPEDPTAPPIPSAAVEVTPLFDDEGDPLPQPKNNGTMRADNSGGALPEGNWVWADSCSKDQLVGQVFAMVSLYDAMKDDPDIDQALVAQLEEDARLIGEMLMTKREISVMEGPVGVGLYDLIIMDADGRPTYHHDLNPLSMEKFYVPPDQGAYNLFNLMMSWGIIKGLHHVSGDESLEAFLYEDLLAEREYPAKLNKEHADEPLDYIYLGYNTNTDNPDLTAVALWVALYTENDPETAAPIRRFMEESWWDRDGEHHTARLSKQAYWHAIYLTLTDKGTDPALVEELRDLLEGYDLGPYWNHRRENCDADELQAGECLAVDGKTVLTIEGQHATWGWLATESLHPSIRPPSNFDARSNPFGVNGGQAGDVTRLNPGPDLLAAYWIARYQQATAAGEANLSPFARDHRPIGGWPAVPETGDLASEGMTDVPQPDLSVDSGGSPDTGTDLAPDQEPSSDGGGDCAAGPMDRSPMAAGPLFLAGILGLTLFCRRRRIHGEEV